MTEDFLAIMRAHYHLGYFTETLSKNLLQCGQGIMKFRTQLDNVTLW
jgi:hypothetical protein